MNILRMYCPDDCVYNLGEQGCKNPSFDGFMYILEKNNAKAEFVDWAEKCPMYKYIPNKYSWTKEKAEERKKSAEAKGYKIKIMKAKTSGKTKKTGYIFLGKVTNKGKAWKKKV